MAGPVSARAPSCRAGACKLPPRPSTWTPQTCNRQHGACQLCSRAAAPASRPLPVRCSAAAPEHAAARQHPSMPRLGADIPVSLKRATVEEAGGSSGSGKSFLLVLPDVDAVMEHYLSSGQLDRDPYWCEPWPSALVMSRELLRRPQLVAGRRVAELGCGLGLAGLAAAAAGAAEVVMLDREPLALQCALLNAALNGLTAAPAAAAGVDAVQPPSLDQLAAHLSSRDAEQLREWQALLAQQHRERESAAAAGAAALGADAGGSSGSAGASSSRRGARGVVRAEVFDWSRPVGSGLLHSHDVLLLCDCLYEAFSVQPVASVSPQLLRRGGGARLLLADPPDRARHNRECFLDMLCDQDGGASWAAGPSSSTSSDSGSNSGSGSSNAGGFLVEESSEAQVATWEGSMGAWRDVPIALMHLRRAEPGETVGVKLRRRE